MRNYVFAHRLMDHNQHNQHHQNGEPDSRDEVMPLKVLKEINEGIVYESGVGKLPGGFPIIDF